MTLVGKINAEEYAKLDPVIQKEYRKGEGDAAEFFFPDVQEKDGWAFEHIEGLKSAHRSERSRREEWERKHADLARTLAGVDPREVATLPDLKKKIKEMESWQPDEKVAQRLLSVETEYKGKLTEAERARELEVAEREAKISELMLDVEARRILERLKAIDVDMLLPHVHRMARVSRGSDKRWSVVVVDDHGDPMTTKRAGAVGNMQLEELLEGFVKKWPSAFKGTGATGGGASGSGAGGSGGDSKQQEHPNSAAFEKMTPAQKLQALRRQQTKTA